MELSYTNLRFLISDTFVPFMWELFRRSVSLIKNGGNIKLDINILIKKNNLEEILIYWIQLRCIHYPKSEKGRRLFYKTITIKSNITAMIYNILFVMVRKK